MVIFIGGQIGSGKTSIARALAKRLKIKYLEIDAIKRKLLPSIPDYRLRLARNIRFPDSFRKKIYRKAAKELKHLAKSEEHLLVDEALVRKSSRQILFHAAKRYFGDYLVVWVKTKEKLIKERLAKPRAGHLLKDSFGMYLAWKKQFQNLNEADIIMDNNQSLGATVAKLETKIKKKLNRS